MARNRKNRSRLKRSQRCPDIWEMIRRHCNGGGRRGGKGRREKGGRERWVEGDIATKTIALQRALNSNSNYFGENKSDIIS